METKDHLPLFGSGPAYVVTISVLTLTALILHYTGILPSPLDQGLLPPMWTQALLRTMQVLGVLMVLLGITIWCSAVFDSKLTQNIKENHLVTTGIYGWVRHPIYSAFTLAEWGLLLWTGNGWLWILIPVYWLFFSQLMIHTEEKWLHARYGQEYADYCQKVHRCIPWFPKK